MPSSLIFVGLVVLWLLILVPTVARRQQEVARLSPALLSGRVLERPARHRHPEVLVTQRSGPTTVGELAEARDDVPAPRERSDEADQHAYDDVEDTEIDDEGRVRGPGGADHHDHDLVDHDDDVDPDERVRSDRERDPRSDDDHEPAVPVDADDEHGTDADGLDEVAEEGWSRPPARYRPGRGGFDPEAAAAAAHAKYAFRQRVVLGLLVLLLAAGAAALLVSTVFWWVTGVVGAGLVGYLTYLRRQVRIEEGIRARRAARLAGTRQSPAADDPELDEWAHRGRDASAEERAADEIRATAAPVTAGADEDDDWTADDGEPTRVRGTGEPLGVLPARGRTVEGPVGTEHESSLPRLAAAPPPPVPAGTSLVDVDAEEEPDEFDTGTPHRRAVGE